MKRIYFLFSLFLFSVLGTASELFEGTIGNSKIYLSIDAYENNEISGIYFYEKSLKDILLSGKKIKNKYVLTFGNIYDLKNFTEKLNLASCDKCPP